jgi:plastocyanin
MATRNQPLMSSNPALFFGVVMFLIFAVGGGAAMYAGTQLVGGEQVAAEDAAGADGPTGGPVTVNLVARNLAFDKRSIAAAPGVEVTINLDNQDAGVLHNAAFYTNRSASTKIFVGELFPGPAQRTEKFTAPTTPGNYFFRCDAHPDQMTGSFVVR